MGVMAPDASGKFALSEEEFRKQVDLLYAGIEKALESVDPDLVDYERSGGVLTLTIPQGARAYKVILSIQPALRQLWLAISETARAYHFQWVNGQWREETRKEKHEEAKGATDLEILEVLGAYLAKTPGIILSLK